MGKGCLGIGSGKDSYPPGAVRDNLCVLNKWYALSIVVHHKPLAPGALYS